MKQLLVSVFVVAACAIVMVWTLPPQQPKRFGAYSLNLHFVPATHRGPCTTNLITPWFPNDTQCAQCFCIRSGFSRCFPKQGCRPTYTPATTLSPNATTPVNGNDVAGSTTVAQPGGTSTTVSTASNNASPSAVPPAAGTSDRPNDDSTTDTAGATETSTVP